MTIPKNARKLTIHGKEWYWKTDGWRTNIWFPNGKKHRFTAEAFGLTAYDCDHWKSFYPIEPAMIRLYIEENLMEEKVLFQPEEPGVGNLFVYRESTSQGPQLTVLQIKGGGFPSRRDRFHQVMKCFDNKEPLFLVEFKTSVDEKVSYAKLLVRDMIVELKIDYPRTFRGSFTLYEAWKEK